jgi:hypothetical protein
LLEKEKGEKKKEEQKRRRKRKANHMKKRCVEIISIRIKDL